MYLFVSTLLFYFLLFFFFFFNDTATTEIYTLSLHDALPICDGAGRIGGVADERDAARCAAGGRWGELHAQGAGLSCGYSEWKGQPADAEARSGNRVLRNGQVGAAGVGQGEVLHTGAAHQHVAEADAGRRDGELRLHSGAAEGDGDGRVGGVADDRGAARHCASGRWGELHTEGAGLPSRKSEWKAQPADAEASYGKTALCNGQVGAAGVGQGEVLHSGAAHQHIAEAHAGRHNGELRLHSGAAEGDGAGRIGGVADEREAARHAAGGRWGELHVKGAGLPRGKSEWKGQPADAEAGSSGATQGNC